MNALPEGTRLDRSNFIHLTPGTVITDGYDDSKVLVLDNGYGYRIDRHRGALYPLYSLAGWQVVTVGDWEPAKENVTTFLQHLRTVGIGSAIENSVRVGPVRAALHSIGATIDTPPLGVGMFVHLADNDLMDRLRGMRDVVLGIGEDPNRWEGFCEVPLARIDNGQLPVVGGVKNSARTMRVVSMANPETEVYLRPPTDEDREEIARLRGRIWQVGMEAKTNERWCTAFENAIGILGISEEAVTQVTAQAPAPTPVAVEDNVPIIGSDEEETEVYPVGAVFEYNGGQRTRPDTYRSDWNWTRRVAGFRFNTRHYIGANGGHYGGRNRRVLWDGRGQMAIEFTRSLMPHLPEGTRIASADSLNGTFYEKMGEHWRLNGQVGAYGCVDRDFFADRTTHPAVVSPWRIIHLPDLP